MLVIPRLCVIFKASDGLFYLTLEQVGGPDHDGEFYGNEMIESFGPYASEDLAEAHLRASFPWPGFIGRRPALAFAPPHVVTALPVRK